MGRPALKVEDYIDKIEQAILLGSTYELAAMFAGISTRTFNTWRSEMENAPDDSPLGQLRLRLIAAEGRAALGWLAQIEKAGREGNWNAAAWKLERRYPEQFGRIYAKADINITGEITLALEDRTRQANERLARLRRVGPDPDQLSA